MRKVIKGLIILVIVSLDTTAENSVVSSKTPTFNDFIDAVIFVESSGNDRAYNEEEDAVGCLQIRPIMVREVNRVLRRAKLHIRYTLDDRWDREKSIEMFRIMAEEIPCDESDTFMKCMEIIARKWNGGYRGHLNDSTKDYWKRVENQIVIKK